MTRSFAPSVSVFTGAGRTVGGSGRTAGSASAAIDQRSLVRAERADRSRRRAGSDRGVNVHRTP
jgi:hypothetical protein